MKKIKRVVIIGSGRWAKVLATEVIKCLGHSVDVYFCVSLRTNEIRQWADTRDLLSRLQIVDKVPLADDHGVCVAIVANSAHDHEKSIRDALLKGYHVIVEKPFTTSSEQSQQAIEFAHRLGRAVFSANTYKFASYLDDFRKLLPTDKVITRMDLLWTDPFQEERYGEIKYYDPRVPVVMDILPHVVSIFEAVYEFEQPSLTSLILKQGGSEVELSFAFNHIESHIRLNRVSDIRRRVIAIWYDSVCYELDFSTEPGIVSTMNKFVIDPLWENKTKPIANMILSVINYFENGIVDSRLHVDTAIKANQFIDLVLPAYRAQQGLYMFENCKRNNVRSPDMRYAILESVQQSRKLAPEAAELILDSLDELTNQIKSARDFKKTC